MANIVFMQIIKYKMLINYIKKCIFKLFYVFEMLKIWNFDAGISVIES